MRIVMAALAAMFFCASACAAPLPRSTVGIATKHGFALFHVEVANDRASQEKGLMYRRHMAPDAGMLFDFHEPEYVTFWMKNTLLPLDMIFIRPDGTIASIAANAEPRSLKLIKSPEAVRAVLEINGGRAAALGIEPGARVKSAIFPGH
jgi:uncharacterized membrane protein (UPF0127 family)